MAWIDERHKANLQDTYGSTDTVTVTLVGRVSASKGLRLAL
jgi:acyl-coenzyme A synthetase/AMP-(fatty) acid ligase